MKGTILHYNQTSNEGIILSNNQRYNFAQKDVLNNDSALLKNNTEVDFTLDDTNKAIGVVLLNLSQTIPTDNSKSKISFGNDTPNNDYKISNTPMVLGIIGGVLGLPAAICSGACATGLSSLAKDTTSHSATSVGDTFLWIGLISAILGLISAFLYKKNSKTWGIVMIFSGILSGITLITFNMLSLIVCIMFLIGGIISLNIKK